MFRLRHYPRFKEPEMNTEKPEWLRKKMPDQDKMAQMMALHKNRNIHTVCVEAHCPNQGECFARNEATFLILGDICTRNCRFCAVKTGRPEYPDPYEPDRVAQAVAYLGLSHVVVTSVTRDDLADQGSHQFAQTIAAIRQCNPRTTVEVLIPDFQGDDCALKVVADAGASVIGHNLETVPDLYAKIRPKADYSQSLSVLENIKALNPKIISKSGLMLGLGETEIDVTSVLRDLRSVGCDILTLGQYLAPSCKHAVIKRYVRPESFENLRAYALSLGFKYVTSGPFVRSSYRAGEAIRSIRRKRFSTEDRLVHTETSTKDAPSCLSSEN